MAVLLPVGTTATLKDEPSGSPAALTNLRGVGGNEGTMSFADVTALADSTLKRLPARLDPGTVQITFYLDDTAVATNQLAALKAKRDAKQKVTVAVNLPGSFDDASTLISYTGYIATVSNPEIMAGDDALTYTITIQISAA